MFKMTFCMAEDPNTYDSIIEAFNALAKKVFHQLNNGGLSYQLLETACWVEQMNPQQVLMFYEARDEAIRQGWKKEMIEENEHAIA